jgi:hypothetical protein
VDHTNDTRVAYHLPVAAAAERLGLSQAAVRQRIKRGSLEVRRKDGRVFVVLSQDILDAENERQKRTITRSRPRGRAMVRTTARTSSENKGLGDDPQPSGKEDEGLSKAFDDLAEAFARDMKRQIERLEGQVDNLQAELRRKDEQHGDEMERKDILLRGYQQQVETLSERIAVMADRPQLMAPSLPIDYRHEQEEAKATRQVLSGIVDVLGRIYRRGRDG